MGMKLMRMNEKHIESELVAIKDGRKYRVQKKQRNNYVLGVLMQ